MSATTPDYAQALELFKAGNYREALPLLEERARLSPDEQTLYGLAMCLARLSRWSDAEAVLVQLVERHPEQPAYARELEAVRGHAGATEHNPGPLDPAALGTDTRSAVPGTLANLLETDDPTQAGLREFTGELLLRGRRQLLSHRRLWLGAAMLLALPALGWVEGEVREVGAATADPGVREVVADIADLVGSMAFLVILASLGLMVGAVLSSRMSTYAVWSHRMDITTGVVFRRHRTVWFYKLLDVQLVQDPVLLLAGTAALVLSLDETTPSTRRPPRVVGMGPTRSMRRLQDQLLYLSAHERRGMKKQFI